MLGRGAAGCQHRQAQRHHRRHEQFPGKYLAKIDRQNDKIVAKIMFSRQNFVQNPNFSSTNNFQEQMEAAMTDTSSDHLVDENTKLLDDTLG